MDKKTLLRVIRFAERIRRSVFPSLQDLYTRQGWTGARNITRNIHQPSNGLFRWLPPGESLHGPLTETQEQLLSAGHLDTELFTLHQTITLLIQMCEYMYSFLFILFFYFSSHFTQLIAIDNSLSGYMTNTGIMNLECGRMWTPNQSRFWH